MIMFRSFCSALVLVICLSVLSMPAVSVLESVDRISVVKPPVNSDEFAQEYFAAFKATQLPGATKDNLEKYLALLHEDVGYAHLPWVPDDDCLPDGKQAMREGMTFYLGSHTEYEAELLNVFTFDEVALAIRYRHKAKGVNPQNNQVIEYESVMMEILEMEEGKVAVIRKYDE